MSACTAQPISCLRLERYALAELPAAEHAAIEAHLAGCAACRQALHELRSSEVTLRPLSARAARPPYRLVVRAAGGLALAAALLLAVRAGLTGPHEQNGEHGGQAVKGGELALELVRERGGDVALDPRSFMPGDRFEALVSCPPNGPVYWDLVVYQGGQAFFPLSAQQALHCGNHVSLPGAFMLTGDAPATVCAVLGPAPLARSELARASADSLPPPHACTTVLPEPARR